MDCKWVILFSLPSCLAALEQDPWLGNYLEFQASAAYTYSRYSHVQGGEGSLHGPSSDQLITLDLGLPFSSVWDVQIEAEIADTPRETWGVRSGAIQLRRLWFDDVIGDPVSLTTGALLRGVPSRMLHDVSCPYNANVNYALNGAVGKEWSEGSLWIWRLFGLAELGVGNQGSPWLKGLISVQNNQQDRCRYELFVCGIQGFGHEKEVDIDHFRGYGSIDYKAIDVGLIYTHLFDLWGSITAEYTYRLYARDFPERVQFFTLSYHLPFSIF